MSDLQAAVDWLDYWKAEDFDWALVNIDHLLTVLDAARLVANPNYEAARVETAAWFDRYRKSSDITVATDDIVAAALTPPGDTG